MRAGFFHSDSSHELGDGTSGKRFELGMKEAAADVHLGCDFCDTEIFLRDVFHNEINQLFHKFLIAWIVCHLGDIHLFCLFETFYYLAAIVLDALAYKRIGGGTGASAKGIGISILAGVLMGFFYSFVAASMAASKDGVLEAGKLTPYTAVVMFSLGLLLSNFVFNTLMMKKPIVGTPATAGEYFRGSAKNHIIGILGRTVRIQDFRGGRDKDCKEISLEGRAQGTDCGTRVP